MGSKKQVKPILLYNLLMKEITKINKLLPEDRKLSVAERRDVISKKIYPKYKGQARSRIKLTPLRDNLVRVIKRLPVKPGGNVLAIPPQTYQDIPYYEIESFIQNILPSGIFIQVDAGKFGRTNIFNTRDFNYYSTGLSDITNRINQEARNENMNTSTIPDYNGVINLRPKKVNDGTPENYYLQMTLSGTGRRKYPDFKIPYKKKTKKQQKKEANIKEYIRERLKALQQEKSVFKRIRQDVSRSANMMTNIVKTKDIPYDQKKATVKSIYNGVSKRIEKHLKEGTISERKHASIKKQIERTYEKIKNKDFKA